MSKIRSTVWLAAGAFLAGSFAVALAQEGASAQRVEKARALLAAGGWGAATRAQVEAEFAASERAGTLPPRFLETFRKEAADDALLSALAPDLAATLDEESLDAGAAFFATPAGRKLGEALRRAAPGMPTSARRWGAEGSDRAKAAIRKAVLDEAKGDLERVKGDLEGLLEETDKLKRDIKREMAKGISLNEITAVSLLRSIAKAQAEVIDHASIDVDRDGEGEFGTLAELTSSVGRRRGLHAAGGGDVLDGADFGKTTTPINPPMLKELIGAIGKSGVAERSGYAFVVYLPDSAKNHGWLHETGPGDAPGLEGGTGKIGIDAAEKSWCAYAWPLEAGVTGGACFFVDTSGKVMRSENTVAKWSGAGKPPLPGSAVSASTEPGKADAPGADGDVWKESK